MNSAGKREERYTIDVLPEQEGRAMLMQKDHPGSVHDGVRLSSWQASWAERFRKERRQIHDAF